VYKVVPQTEKWEVGGIQETETQNSKKFETFGFREEERVRIFASWRYSLSLSIEPMVVTYRLEGAKTGCEPSKKEKRQRNHAKRKKSKKGSEKRF
jgi:hypothetical protein